MKKGSSFLVWLVFLGCAATVAVAMTWLTRNVLESERERSVAQARADLQERMRLSLWRMDTAGTGIILEESQRPFLPDEKVPASAVAKMRFELTETGELSASQGEDLIPDLRTLLRETSEGRAMFAALCGSLDNNRSAWNADVEASESAASLQSRAPNQSSEVAQASYNVQERVARIKGVTGQLTKALSNSYAEPPDPFASEAIGKVLREAGTWSPMWLGDNLFLMRELLWVETPGQGGKSIQGIWINAAELKQILLSEVRDLLPFADLTPAQVEDSDSMVLASFPWKLQPGDRGESSGVPRPILVSLGAGWLAVILALVAVSLLVRGIMRLSERRASFVSAVTHELRTPLTTFRLYSDMLEAGAVKEEKRHEYLQVLSREADRLSHLVENVLAFSGIERGSARAVMGEMTLGSMLEPLRERFTSRLEAAGLALRMDLEPELASETLRTDTAAVEHILFNLVDNAAKYAMPSSVPEVGIIARKSGRFIAIQVSDHGPGVPSEERKKIFRPFHKSAQEAARTRPGVGLGLALSRRLARALGGELEYAGVAGRGGAHFILKLPVT
jgi:signal transduction histidine kinase